jgi:hypothetical protein
MLTRLLSRQKTLNRDLLTISLNRDGRAKEILRDFPWPLDEILVEAKANGGTDAASQVATLDLRCRRKYRECSSLGNQGARRGNSFARKVRELTNRILGRVG